MFASARIDHPITLRREELGLTQEALAGRAKIDVRTVRRAERGQRVSAETLQALAHGLGIEITVLTQHQARYGSDLADIPPSAVEDDRDRATTDTTIPRGDPKPDAGAGTPSRVLPVIRSDKTGRAKLIAKAQHLFAPIDDIEMIVLPNLKPRLDRVWILVLLASVGILAWGMVYGWGLEPDPIQSTNPASIFELQTKAVSTLKSMLLPLLPMGLAAIGFLKVLQKFQFIAPTVVYGIGPHIWLTLRHDNGQPHLKRITRQADGRDGLAIYPFGDAMTCVLRDRSDEARLSHLPNDPRIREVLTRLEHQHEARTDEDDI